MVPMKKMLRGLLMLAALWLVSCTGSESQKGNVVAVSAGEPFGKVLSAAQAKMLTPLALWGENSATGHIYFELTKPYDKDLTITFKVNEQALTAYNNVYGTSYTVYPADKISLEANGQITIPAGKKRSDVIDVSIQSGANTETIYALPLTAEVSDGTQTISNNAAYIYLVTPLTPAPAINEGRTIKNLCYVEVNRESMLNTGEYIMKETKEPFFDIASVFAANIRLNEEGQPYVSCNEQTRFVLDNIDQIVRPLQAKGMKVHLSILGDHTAAGMRSLTKEAAVTFAQELKYYMDIYGFDGIDFDDEYSTYVTDQKVEPYIPAPTVAPSIEECTKERYAELVYECRKLMPDKTLGIYWYTGSDYPAGEVEGKTVNDLIDYSIYGLYGKWRSIDTDTVATAKQCPYAVEVTTAKGDVKINPTFVKRIKDDKWGYFAVYDLNDERHYEKEFTEISRILYGQDVEWTGKSFGRTDFTPKAE